MTTPPPPFPRSRSAPSSLALRLATLLAIAAAPLPVAAQSPPAPTARQYHHGAVIASHESSNYSQQNDLRLTVDTRWVHNHGYRPIRLRFVSRKLASSERRVAVRLHIEGPDKVPLVVEQSFDLSLAAQDTNVVIRVPQLFGDDRCWWDVWIDGVRDPELSVSESDSWNFSPAGTPRSQGASLALLLVSDDARPRQFLANNADPFAGATVAIDDLPTTWIDYSAVDIVALTPRALRRLQSTRPEALAALNRWLRAGGQMWVYQVGPAAEQLPAVERCLELTHLRPLPQPFDLTEDDAAHDKQISPSDAALIARGWRPLSIGANDPSRPAAFRHKPTGRVEIVRDAAAIARLKLDPEFEAVDNPEPPAGAATTRSRDTAPWYLERPVGLGRVRAYRGDWDPVGFSIAYRLLGGGTPNQVPFDPVPATPVTTAVQSTRDWPKRHGLTPEVASADFADFLVPGMGLAPVNEFRVLITLFVLAIGPLNYWLLMRANRLHLLLLTVPLLALALTAGLFGYALISDGLGTVVRVRSFTTLDQTTGEAATWARLSYYAGLAPGAGLAVDDDVAVYPILSEWDNSDPRESDNRRELEYRDGRQLFSKGWLRSRFPIQYLTVRARRSPRRIDFVSADGTWSAANRLGTRILYLAMVDEAGNVFTESAIDPDARVPLQPATHADALAALREWMLNNQPQLPTELLPLRAADSNRGSSRPGRFRGPADPDLNAVRMSDNLLNTALADLVAGNADSVLNVPRRSYIAITESGPEVELGVPDAAEEASFHVLLGSW